MQYNSNVFQDTNPYKQPFRSGNIFNTESSPYSGLFKHIGYTPSNNWGAYMPYSDAFGPSTQGGSQVQAQGSTQGATQANATESAQPFSWSKRRC
jgi:hypothetical protein